MVMDAHRDHYEGTPYDLTKGMAAGPFGNPNRAVAVPGVIGKWERAISMHRTSWAFVLEAKPHGRSIVWFCWDSPHGSVFLPFWGAASQGAPKSYHSIDGFQSRFSTNVAWWAFNLVNQYEGINFRLINSDVRSKALQVEEEAFRKVAAWEMMLGTNGSSLGDIAVMDRLTRASNEFADAKVQEWWAYGWSLFAKYGRLVQTFNESAPSGENALAQAYPAWWLKSDEVAFTTNDGHPGTPGIHEATQFASLKETERPYLAVPLAAVSVAVMALLVYQAGVWRGRQESKASDVYVLHP
jgi:hypothetical protein